MNDLSLLNELRPLHSNTGPRTETQKWGVNNSRSERITTVVPRKFFFERFHVWRRSGSEGDPQVVYGYGGLRTVRDVEKLKYYLEIFEIFNFS